MDWGCTRSIDLQDLAPFPHTLFLRLRLVGMATFLPSRGRCSILVPVRSGTPGFCPTPCLCVVCARMLVVPMTVVVPILSPTPTVCLLPSCTPYIPLYLFLLWGCPCIPATPCRTLSPLGRLSSYCIRWLCVLERRSNDNPLQISPLCLCLSLPLLCCPE